MHIFEFYRDDRNDDPWSKLVSENIFLSPNLSRYLKWNDENIQGGEMAKNWQIHARYVRDFSKWTPSTKYSQWAKSKIFWFSLSLIFLFFLGKVHILTRSGHFASDEGLDCNFSWLCLFSILNNSYVNYKSALYCQFSTTKNLPRWNSKQFLFKNYSIEWHQMVDNWYRKQ